MTPLEELNVIITSPLMYAIVGVFLFEYTMYRTKKMLRKLEEKYSKEVKSYIEKIVKALLESLTVQCGQS